MHIQKYTYPEYEDMKKKNKFEYKQNDGELTPEKYLSQDYIENQDCGDVNDRITINTIVGDYTVETVLKDNINEDAIAIVMVSYESYAMTRNAIASFKKFATIPTEIYLVDNFSDNRTVEKLRQIKDINLILNRGKNKQSILTGYKDSILNAVGVDLGMRFVKSKYVFVCHNDVLALDYGWLKYLFSKMNDQNLGACFFLDNDRIKAMHVSGYLCNLEYYKKKMAEAKRETFWYPHHDKTTNKMTWDVGDHYTQLLRENDKDYFVSKNTHNHPEAKTMLNCDIIKKHNLGIDISMNDTGNALYAHLGRGAIKFIGTQKDSKKTTYEQWVAFGKDILNKE